MAHNTCGKASANPDRMYNISTLNWLAYTVAYLVVQYSTVMQYEYGRYSYVGQAARSIV
jgi:hypothetical protein